MKNPQWPLLLVDDEASWLRSLSMTLKSAGGYNHLLKCQDSRQVLEILSQQPVSLVLLDLTMPHLSGQELLPRIVEAHPEVPVIVLSGLNQLETAVQCMKGGAFDYFVKTEDQERLLVGIRRALAHRDLQRECRRLREQLLQDELQHPEAFAGIVTRNKKMQTIFKYIEAVAASGEPVLITGESGVGKELIARAIHETSRCEQPWVALNAAGLDDNVFADTLFGHRRGAFTGADRPRPGMLEQAGRGTLFLDEIGDLAPCSQIKLLRVLQDREFFAIGSDTPNYSHARFIFATNLDLETAQSNGSFRRDLYYRIRSHRIHVPPLRERPEDIPLLLGHFLEEAACSLGKKVPTPPPELAILLSNYAFPGNIRELRALVYDAVALHSGGKLSMESFKKAIADPEIGAVSTERSQFKEDPLLQFGSHLPTLEKAGELLVDEAMTRSRGNQTIAAHLLGISRQALSKRLKKRAPDA